ncbi:hypothetical protein [Cupriavidus nantongensis]|uniref:Uncharacterized protein n=1 Tax=Cupriavidus nantongensis TaxID=1796606 RepID=A0A142JGP6_9BURK|nr:hypothetical protein [Cupriavidus nantongensis]AMR77258.1 hypothetical protein A2G96_05665 [Cupriavidus nantongensis]
MQSAELVVDWHALLIQLQRAGQSTSKIAAGSNVSRSTFLGWKNHGAQPRHPDGERMIAFWSQVTGKNRADLPMMRMEFSAARINSERARPTRLREDGFVTVRSAMHAAVLQRLAKA